jgi:phage regulator Rha-like protein
MTFTPFSCRFRQKGKKPFILNPFSRTLLKNNTMDILKFNSVEEKIITLRGISVILDSDVAELYGVETKEINQAVRNNPEKFPDGFLFTLEQQEFEFLRSKILTTNFSKTRVLPKAFTEQGLYMLATILKSSKATQATLGIIQAFTKLRELSRAVAQLSETQDETKKKSLMQRSGEIIADILGDGLEVTDAETTWEVNLALMKFKRTVRQKKK